MKQSFVFALLTVLTLSVGAQAQVRDKFTMRKGININLAEETNKLALQNEETVQRVNPPSTLFVTALLGVMDSTFLEARGNGKTVDYNHPSNMPLFTAQFSKYFSQKTTGRWGATGSIGYSYSEYAIGAQSTALHVIPIQLAVTFRGEWKSTQSVMPFISAGPTVMTYFQRGLDEYKTSQSTVLGSLAAGLAFNLNRLGLKFARNDTEVVLQYQRNIAPASSTTDWNGNVIQLGGTLAL